MLIHNHSPKFFSDDPIWYLLSDCSLSVDILKENLEVELSTKMLPQVNHELQLPLETLNKIKSTISAIARWTKVNSNQSVPCAPVDIYLFCHKKMIERLNNSQDCLDGGWGYYVIEKSRNFNQTGGQEYHRVIEVYLYREGE